MEYRELLEKAEKRKQENEKFLKNLKKKKPRDLDVVIHGLHEDTFTGIDCLKCANCCKTTSPIFYQKDIERAAKSLRMKPSRFIEEYLKIDEDNDFVLKSSPCPFLDDENYCMIYEDRPAACRDYPHTERKRMHQYLDLALKNTLICPAVSNIVENLKKAY